MGSGLIFVEFVDGEYCSEGKVRVRMLEILNSPASTPYNDKRFVKGV